MQTVIINELSYTLGVYYYNETHTLSFDSDSVKIQFSPQENSQHTDTHKVLTVNTCTPTDTGWTSGVWELGA